VELRNQTITLMLDASSGRRGSNPRPSAWEGGRPPSKHGRFRAFAGTMRPRVRGESIIRPPCAPRRRTA
jgi:hypothetical protein